MCARAFAGARLVSDVLTVIGLDALLLKRNRWFFTFGTTIQRGGSSHISWAEVP